MTNQPDKPTIDYRAGRDDLPQRMGRFVALGVIVSFIAVYVVLFSWAASTHFAVPATITTVVVAVLGTLGWRSYRRYRWRGFALGLLIGLGAGALIEGVCFAAISR